MADQLSHALDVNQNVYTQAGLHRRKAAVDVLESALANSLMEQTEHTDRFTRAASLQVVLRKEWETGIEPATSSLGKWNAIVNKELIRS